MTGDGQRRHRRRASRSAGAPSDAPDHATDEQARTAPTSHPSAARSEPRGSRATRAADRGRAERSMRELAGSGRSYVGVSGALRARDVNRPTDEDLAEAERDLAIVHRHWRPAEQTT